MHIDNCYYWYTMVNKRYKPKMSKEKLYISGKMNGLDNYHELFNKAEDEYSKKGYKVINPARFEHIEGKWSDFMLHDLHVLDKCDSILMLNNWKESNGAQVEYWFAQGKGLKIIYQE